MERYVLKAKADAIQETFGIGVHSLAMLEPNYNAAPGHALPVLAKNKMEPAIWDSETPQFPLDVITTELFGPESIPCIVPVSGFYMWKQTVNDPLPFFVRIHSRMLLGVAGILFESEKLRGVFRVLTRPANVLLKPLNEFMPCILDPVEYKYWLTGQTRAILGHGFAHNSMMPEMTVFRVPDLVNDISNNSPELIQPIPKLRDED